MKAKLILLLILGAFAASAATVGYVVNVDTTSIQGLNGFVDFELASPGPPPVVTVNIDGLTIDGGDPASLAGFTLANDTTDLFRREALQFGSSLRFTLSILYDTDVEGSFTESPFNLYFVSDEMLLINPDGPAFSATVQQDGSVVTTNAPEVDVAQIPEPASAILIGSGLLAVAVFTRRLRKAV